jgi:hypothetical protein
MSERKTDELATNSKNKNIRDQHRGINNFQRGNHPRNNSLKVEELLLSVIECT